MCVCVYLLSLQCYPKAGDSADGTETNQNKNHKVSGAVDGRGSRWVGQQVGGAAGGWGSRCSALQCGVGALCAWSMQYML